MFLSLSDTRNLFLLLIFLISPQIFSQDNKKEGLWLSSAMHYGFVVAHHESMNYLINGHSPGGEIAVFKTTNGQRQWQRAYRDPEIGLSIFYIYLSNPSQLGFGLGVNPYVNFPLIEKRKFGLKFKAGTSVGYISKIFDRVNNFKNNVVGSHFNGFVNLRLNAHYLVTDDFRMEFGFGISHFSNGAFRMPNLGINALTVNLGAGWKIKNLETKYTADSTTGSPQGSKFEIVLIGGGCKAEVNPPVGMPYPAFTFSSSADWLRSQKHRFLFGVELGYNGGNIKGLTTDSVHINKKSEMLQEGIKLGYALRVGSLELPLELGCYVHTLYKDNGNYFHRIGLRYYFPNNMVANLTLKTHWATANYWELGIGYAFRIKNQK